MAGGRTALHKGPCPGGSECDIVGHLGHVNYLLGLYTTLMVVEVPGQFRRYQVKRRYCAFLGSVREGYPVRRGVEEWLAQIVAKHDACFTSNSADLLVDVRSRNDMERRKDKYFSDRLCNHPELAEADVYVKRIWGDTPEYKLRWNPGEKVVSLCVSIRSMQNADRALEKARSSIEDCVERRERNVLAHTKEIHVVVDARNWEIPIDPKAPFRGFMPWAKAVMEAFPVVADVKLKMPYVSAVMKQPPMNEHWIFRSTLVSLIVKMGNMDSQTYLEAEYAMHEDSRITFVVYHVITLATFHGFCGAPEGVDPFLTRTPNLRRIELIDKKPYCVDDREDDGRPEPPEPEMLDDYCPMFALFNALIDHIGSPDCKFRRVRVNPCVMCNREGRVTGRLMDALARNTSVTVVDSLCVVEDSDEEGFATLLRTNQTIESVLNLRLGLDREVVKRRTALVADVMLNHNFSITRINCRNESMNDMDIREQIVRSYVCAVRNSSLLNRVEEAAARNRGLVPWRAARLTGTEVCILNMLPRSRVIGRVGRKHGNRLMNRAQMQFFMACGVTGTQETNRQLMSRLPDTAWRKILSGVRLTDVKLHVPAWRAKEPNFYPMVLFGS